MAEFKLGRIRFVWKNNWTAGNTYYRDDVVLFGGRMYIAVEGHVAQNDFYLDSDITPPKWNLVSDGQNWKGEWAPNTYYVYNDIVKYGARLYIATTVHTSAATVDLGLENDVANWAIFGEGLDYKGEWGISTRYKINDMVKYGGLTYVANTVHTSAATDALGLEADQDKWDVFNSGIEFNGEFATFNRYKVNDVVKYGGNLFVCNTAHTSTADFADNADKFDSFVQGIQFESNWRPIKVYQAGDIVAYGGNQYIAKRQNTGQNPHTSTDDWDLYAKGFNFRGEWGDDSTLQDYRIGDVVRVNGYTYVATDDSQDKEPGLATDWADYWERLNGGFHWRGIWTDDQEYKLGDIVRFGTNSYIAIKSHISEGDDGSSLGGDANSRPDLDVTGTYWNLLVIGTEVSVLTTKGDLVYYGGAGPTRLPVGKEGQVLRVSEDLIPEWTYLGESEDVYYVSQAGADKPAPTNGLTLDKPFKSIRYACLQVEAGTKVPEARRLLELNRQFIQRETTEWTDWQISNSVPPFATNFNYDSVKCERDIGLIIDAVLYDLGHGGNVQTREAALYYVTEGGKFYTNGQEEETNASIAYAKVLMNNVLSNTAPSTNYQVTNGDNSTAVVDQIFNTGLSAEVGVSARITELLKIVTDAITAGEADNIPARYERTVLIKVATGKYSEVLPISVPAQTCIMGDELRATVVEPKKQNLTPKADFKYSYQALDHIQEVLPDIIQGVAVTPTTGNNEVQSQEWPFGEAAEGNAGSHLFRSIKRNIDFKLKTKLEADMTDTYAMGDPDYGRARDLLILNKDFIAVETTGWIKQNYPTLDYSRTKCKEDVGYVLDAITYDLTYGGNWQSVTAGEAYFNGRNGTLQIDSEEKTATLAAYGYVKYLAQNIARNLVINPVYQSTIDQNRAVAGSLAASNTIADRMDEIIDIINLGPTTVAITYPDVTGSPADWQTISTAVDAARTTIGEHTIDFINYNFGTFRYNSATCRRDLNNIMTDIAYDVALGTNYNGVYNGRRYNSPVNEYNLRSQRTETVGAIKFAKTQVRDELVNATAITRSNAAFDEIIDMINNGLTAEDALSFPSPVGVDINRERAKDLMISNLDFIKAEVTAWIDVQIAGGAGIWSGFTYDSTKCARDVGYITDAQCYDILYGGTMATTRVAESYFGIYGSVYPASQGAQTAAAYGHLASILSDVVQENVITASAGNTETQIRPGSPATGAEATEIDGNVQIIEDVITAGNQDSLPAVVRPDITWASAALQTDKASIDSANAEIILDTIQFITDTYDDFKFIHSKCSRDVGLIIDAARYDLKLGTNFAGIVAAYSYLRRPSQNVLKDQKTASLAAFKYALTLVEDEINATGASAPNKASAIAGFKATWDWIDTVLYGGAPEGSNRAVALNNVYSAIRQVDLNKDFIVAETHAYINDYFSDTVTATDAATEELTVTSTAWLSKNMPIKFTGTAIGGVTLNQTYYVREITSATQFTISETEGASAVNIAAGSGSMTVGMTYDYSIELCSRDVLAFIDAAKNDMKWSQEFKRTYNIAPTYTSAKSTLDSYYFGNYESYRAARYYVNSVLGSQEEDFYYLRDGTGIRLQTMQGLDGDLSPNNEFGTKRPTAGAYVSLDPGWGPDDERVWIKNRSPYVQNNTTFGHAATGQRIDGALHNGGNDSIVSNDFTQVISDGIGAHILNNGRAELVSVFTYYSHIGYLAETGGRVRATNGNNSYGDFGSVAEGVDPFETAVTGIVDNKGLYSADPNEVTTNGVQILGVEYNHAGNEYTEARIDIFGAGQGAETEVDEFRDGGVYNVRILELNDSSGQLGGEGYTVAENTAQAGSSASITLAATDGSVAGAYDGMKVYITGGAGVGQYGIASNYNSGSKAADITNEAGDAGWDHIVPGTPITAPNSSSTYRVEPAVSFTKPTNSTTAVGSVLNAASNASIFGYTSAIYSGVTGSTESGGTGFTVLVTKVGSKYSLVIESGGQDYIRGDEVLIPGTSVGGATPANDITVTLTTVVDGVALDFDFEGDAAHGAFLFKDSSGAVMNYSLDGASYAQSSLPNAPAGASNWDLAHGMIDDGSSFYKESSFIAMSSVAGAGGTVAWESNDAVNWNELTVPALTGNKYVSFNSYINEFLAFGDGGQDVIRSGDGTNWFTVPNSLPGTGYDFLQYGQGKWVIVKSATNEAAYSEDGSTWTATTLASSGNWQDIAYGNGRFMLVSDNNTIQYSLDGITWYDGTINADATVRSFNSIEYGHGVFVATQTTTANFVMVSEYGLEWEAVACDTMTSGGQVVHGNPGFVGQFHVANSGNGNLTQVITGARARGRVGVAQEKVYEVRITEPGSTYDFSDPLNAPTMTITDPNNIYDVTTTVRVGYGVLSQPSFVNRGSAYELASADLISSESNGFADFFQEGVFVAVKRLSERPVPGSNVVFDSLPDKTFKLVNLVSFRGDYDGSYTAFLNISPEMLGTDSPPDGDAVTMRIRYSQVRLTGHDFLDIGTGNFTKTNYPGTPLVAPDPSKETKDANGGRVFYTSTDQDGNFRVGDLFTVEQATGIATLNADAFNIAGLQELSLGEVTLGGNSASVNEFSTDPFFTANSDSVVPTQRAIKAFIEAQIGGGGASLNVNTVTAGDIFIGQNFITTVSGELINIRANINFEGDIIGLPVAYNYFLR